MNLPQAITTAFNDAINARDLPTLAALMVENHRFVDSAGATITGKAGCIEAWRGFFSAFPDYRNTFEHMRGDGDVVTISGRSECSDPRLNGPALWRAVIAGAKVLEWRVFDDTETERRALGLSVDG